MEPEVVPIRHILAVRRGVEGADHPLALPVVEEHPAELIQGQHPPGEDLLQPLLLPGALAQGLDPLGEAHQHQVGLHESVFGLLGHRLGQVGRVDLRLGQVMAPGLLQLQVQQATQAQEHHGDEAYRRLEQGQAFQGAIEGMYFVDGDRQWVVLTGKGVICNAHPFVVCLAGPVAGTLHSLANRRLATDPGTGRLVHGRLSAASSDA